MGVGVRACIFLLSNPTANTPPTTTRALETLLPGCNIVKMVCAAPPLLCSDIEGSIARKLLWVREMVRASCMPRAMYVDGVGVGVCI